MTEVRIACDARSGACNPEVISELLERGARIRDVPRLHAKVYLGQSSMVVASANASANGLGEESSEINLGLEAGYLVRSSDAIAEARKWFDQLFANGSVVSQSDLKELRAVWRSRRNGKPHRHSVRRSFLQILLDDPEFFIEKSIKIVVSGRGEISDEATESYKESDFYDEEVYDGLDYVPFYENTEEWQVEPQSLVVDLLDGKSGLTFTGIWRVLGSINNGIITPVHRVTTPFGLHIPKGDVTKIAKFFTLAIKRIRPELHSPTDLGEFLRAVRDAI